MGKLGSRLDFLFVRDDANAAGGQEVCDHLSKSYQTATY